MRLWHCSTIKVFFIECLVTHPSHGRCQTTLMHIMTILYAALYGRTLGFDVMYGHPTPNLLTYFLCVYFLWHIASKCIKEVNRKAEIKFRMGILEHGWRLNLDTYFCSAWGEYKITIENSLKIERKEITKYYIRIAVGKLYQLKKIMIVQDIIIYTFKGFVIDIESNYFRGNL